MDLKSIEPTIHPDAWTLESHLLSYLKIVILIYFFLELKMISSILRGISRLIFTDRWSICKWMCTQHFRWENSVIWISRFFFTWFNGCWWCYRGFVFLFFVFFYFYLDSTIIYAVIIASQWSSRSNVKDKSSVLVSGQPSSMESLLYIFCVMLD